MCVLPPPSLPLPLPPACLSTPLALTPSSPSPTPPAQHHDTHTRTLADVGQIDEHIPQLTVRETLQFVHDNCSVDPGQHGYPHLAAAHAGRVQDVMDLLHLNGCAATPIGNDLMRGVSGGEKKRVTVAEGLLTEARFLALDEISTGLDSAVTYDIVRRLRTRAATQGLTALVTLLQPTPETYALFDSVILLREGAVLYHGPTQDLPDYLRGLGYAPPTVAQARAAMGGGSSSSSSSSTALLRATPSATSSLALSLDLADWLLQFLSDPAAVQGEEARGWGVGSATAPPPPTSTAALSAAWKGSAAFSRLMAPSTPGPLALQGSYARAQFGCQGYARPWATHLGYLLGRQAKLMLRNLLYMRSRIMQAIIMSIVLGGLYYQRTPDQGATYVGTFLNSLMIMGFANMSEMAPAGAAFCVAFTLFAPLAPPPPPR